MLSGTDVSWAHDGRLGVSDGTDGGGKTVPYVGAGHWEGTPSELRPAQLCVMWIKLLCSLLLPAIVDFRFFSQYVLFSKTKE